MKKLMTVLFTALIVSGIPPVFANANSAAAATNVSNLLTSAGNSYRIAGGETHTFKRFVNRGHVDILIVGDGGTDLDLYVYIGGDREASDGNSDDEKVCLPDISRSGYITIKVVNRGWSSNTYELFIK